MNSEKITQTFTGLVAWSVAGRYFKLLETANPVTVSLFRAGVKVLSAVNVEGGFYQRIDFDRVEITTGGAEAVSWMYAPAEGGSDRFTGAVTISGTPNVNVSDRAPRLLGIAYGSLGQIAQESIGGVNALSVSERAYLAGVNFVSVTVINSTATETVLAAGSNPNGAIVWRSQILSGTGAAGHATRIVLLAKSSVPTTTTDGVCVNMCSCYSPAVSADTGNVMANSTLERPRFIPAGLGLYFYNGGNNEVVAMRTVDYTIL